MSGRKRDDAPPKQSRRTPDPAAVARAKREADALREAARELPEIDPADAEYW
jgi:hypothetical protein